MGLAKRNIEAPAFALLVGQTSCWKCSANTPVAALWIPAHNYWHEPDRDPDHEDDPSLLGFVEALSEPVLVHVRRHAPWMAFVAAKTAGFTYLANFCTSCSAVQGDHHLREPGEVFFPETPAQLRELQLIPGDGTLEARAAPAVSRWMSDAST